MPFIEFNTSNGILVQVLPVAILLGKSANFSAYLFLPSGLHHQHYHLTGEDYARWGTDDDYIKHYICDKHAILGRPLSDTDENGPIIMTNITAIPNDNDSKSVHNEADIQRIQTLQEQMDAQAAKLKTITDLLFKNGAF